MSSRTWSDKQTDDEQEENPICKHGIDRTEERCSECDKWDFADFWFDFYGER